MYCFDLKIFFAKSLQLRSRVITFAMQCGKPHKRSEFYVKLRLGNSAGHLNRHLQYCFAETFEN